MTKVWRELADPQKHRDHMSSTNDGGLAVAKSRDKLIEKWVYIVDIYDFEFHFSSLEQVREAKSYFEQKIRPSTRNASHNPYERWWQQWYCKLPKGLMKEKRRLKMIAALEKVLQEFG